MFRYDKVEKVCNKYGFLIELCTYNYSKRFVINTYDTRCKQGKVPVGYIEFEDIITRNGVQYVKKIHLYNELTMK